MGLQEYTGQPAANDTFYLPPRHRTLPILSSGTPIANYASKLRILQTNASRYWQVRCYLIGKTCTQSLRAVHKQAASGRKVPILRNRIHNSILPLFGQMPMDQAGFKALSDLVQQLSSREFSTTTLQQHLVAVREVLTHADGVGLIDRIPSFPSIKVVNKPRGSFSVAEYRDLVRHARRQTGRKLPHEFADKSRSSAAILHR